LIRNIKRSLFVKELLKKIKLYQHSFGCYENKVTFARN